MVNFLRKRLQVFVSSTFTDLQDERQAAVEAILVAGHIPAGMELFTAGDESQMEVIRQWIDESDVYLLIIGGRYGTVEAKSGKSYTHLEYDYAVAQGKPTFALVVTEQGLDRLVKVHGRSAMESANPQGLTQLRAQVLGKLVRFWTDAKDIRIAIGETLSQFARRDDLLGWVRPQDQSDLPLLASEIARLSHENSQLRTQLAASLDTPQPLGIGYAGLHRVLESKGLHSLLLKTLPELLTQWGYTPDEKENEQFSELLALGVIARDPERKYRFRLSGEGQAFLNWLKLRDLDSARGAESAAA